MQKDLKALFAEYLDKFKTMSVATATPEGKVDCATVYFTTDDDGAIYFTTDKHTVKAANLAANPSVAAAFTDDGASATGLQIRGKVELVTDKVFIVFAKSRLKAKDERIAAFLQNPDLLFFRIVPEERFLLNFAWGVDWRNLVPA